MTKAQLETQKVLTDVGVRHDDHHVRIRRENVEKGREPGISHLHTLKNYETRSPGGEDTRRVTVEMCVEICAPWM